MQSGGVLFYMLTGSRMVCSDWFSDSCFSFVLNVRGHNWDPSSFFHVQDGVDIKKLLVVGGSNRQPVILIGTFGFSSSSLYRLHPNL